MRRDPGVGVGSTEGRKGIKGGKGLGRGSRAVGRGAVEDDGIARGCEVEEWMWLKRGMVGMRL